MVTPTFPKSQEEPIMGAQRRRKKSENQPWKDSQLSINLNGISHGDLHFPDPLAGLHALVIFRSSSGPADALALELVAPGTPPCVSVPIVIAEEVIPAGLLAAADLERLVDRREKILSQVWCEGGDAIEVLGGGGWGKAAEKVAARGSPPSKEGNSHVSQKPRKLVLPLTLRLLKCWNAMDVSLEATYRALSN